MNLIIIGSGSHAGVVIDAVKLLNQYRIIGLLDDVNPAGEFRHGYRIEGQSRMLVEDECDFFVGIGDCAIREKMVTTDRRFINVLHPSARANPPACKGSYFGANCVVGNGAVVGDFCIINTGSILEHDSRIGNFSHMAPGSVTGGHVTIGSRTLIGINASIRPGVVIGNNVLVGMGSVVTKDIPDNSVAYGNPAKIQNPE